MDEVSDATFSDEVLGSNVPVIVEFGAPWCRPCKAIEPALTEIAAESGGRVRLVKLDIDANLGVPSRYGVLSIPTVILFEGGEAQETIVGAHGKSRYQRTFAPYLDG
jgi:thioredoxin 1